MSAKQSKTSLTEQETISDKEKLTSNEKMTSNKKVTNKKKMTCKEKTIKKHWWEESDLENLPPAEVTIEGDTKTVVEWKYNESKEKVRVTRKYRLVKTKMAKSVARRRKLKKFGAEAEGMPGASKATAFIDNVKMEFLHDEDNLVDEKETSKIRREVENKIKEIKGDSELVKKDHASSPAKNQASSTGIYVPPCRRRENGAPQTLHDRKPDYETTLLVTNLSRDATKRDLEDLFKPFGKLKRTTLVADKKTGVSKGVAYVQYYCRQDGENARRRLHKYAYDSLLLNVEWKKPFERRGKKGENKKNPKFKVDQKLGRHLKSFAVC